MIDKILAATWKAPTANGYAGEIQHSVNAIILGDLMSLAANERASNQVRAVASWKLEQLKSWLTLQRRSTTDENHRAFVYYTSNRSNVFRTIRKSKPDTSASSA